MNLGEILDDILLDRFPSRARDRAKRAVNGRLAHLWSIEDWTFRYAYANPATTGGNSQLGGLPTDFGVPLNLWDDLGSSITYVTPADFQSTYLSADGVSSSPESYTVVNQAIYVGPTPTTGATWTMYYRKRATLLDDESDTPAIPTEFHIALVHGGRAELLATYGPSQDAQDMEGQWQLDLQAMAREYLADVEGQPTRWGSDR